MSVGAMGTRATTNDANSLLKSLKGLSWSQWPTFKTEEDVDDNDDDLDVMRLNSMDMAIFGLCPIEDDLILITCDTCGLIVKLEAFEEHLHQVHHEPKAFKNHLSIFNKNKKPVLEPVPSPKASIKVETVSLSSVPSSSSVVQSSSSSSSSSKSAPAPNVLSIKDTDALPRAVRAMVSAGEALMMANDSNSNVDATSPDNNSVHSQCSTPTLSAKSVLLSTPPTPSSRTLSPVSSKKFKSGSKSSSSREYNPDTNCGVIDNDRRCTRALTCKSHSVSLKRKVENRSKPFDILVAEYKASKAEAEANKKNNVVVVTSNNNSTTTTTPPLNINATVESVLSSISGDASSSTITNSKDTNARSFVVGVAGRKRTHDEQQSQVLLPCTQTHPRPLAVANFCSRRIGGFLVSNRAHLVPRKLIRVSIAAGGFQRLRPTKQPNHNNNPTATVLNKPVLITPKGFVVTTATGSRQVISLASNNALGNTHGTVGVNSACNTDQPCFKTEIADFKGGIKFELATNASTANTPLHSNTNSKVDF